MTVAAELKDTSPEKLLAPVLSAFWDEDRSWSMDVYRRHEGYEGLRKALAMSPDDLIAYVKESGLRGRGGAGFPTGMKWQFIPQGDGKPHYLVVNADESEPGTCKDIPLLFANPHSLIEGIVIACYAIRSSHAFIYLRGEVVPVLRRLHEAVREAYAAGYLGENILGSGLDLELTVHAGAARTSAVRRPHCSTRSKAAVANRGFVPPSLRWKPLRLSHCREQRRVDRVGSRHPEKRQGLVQVDGQREVPGLHALLAQRPRREPRPVRGPARHHAPPAPRHERRHAARAPAEVLDTRRLLDADVHRRAPRRPPRLRRVGAAGSMLGTKALQCFDETTCVVRAVTRWTEFYAHESCGKCTPCREGTYWLVQLMRDIEAGKGAMSDLDKLADIADNINGKSFCALGDGAASPIFSSLKYFREEYEQHITGRGCPFDPAKSTAWADRPEVNA